MNKVPISKDTHIGFLKVAVLVLAGLVFLILPNFLHDEFSLKLLFDSLLQTIGVSIVVGAVCASLDRYLLSVQYEKSLSDYCCGKEFLGQLSIERQNELQSSLEEVILPNNEAMHNLYRKVRTQFFKMPKDLYYSNISVTIDVSFDSAAKLIRKRITRIIDIQNITGECISYKLPLQCRLKKIANVPILDCYKVDNVSLNTMDITTPVNKTHEEHQLDGNGFDTLIAYPYEITVVPGANNLEMTVDTIVPFEDMMYAYTLSKYPCEHFNATCEIQKPSNFVVNGSAFSFLKNDIPTKLDKKNQPKQTVT